MKQNYEHLLSAYKTKILAIRNYHSSQKEFFVEDFIVLEKLEGILDEVSTGESDITPAGKSLLARSLSIS